MSGDPTGGVASSSLVFRVNWAGNRGGRRWWVWLVKTFFFLFLRWWGREGRRDGEQASLPGRREKERERRRTRELSHVAPPILDVLHGHPRQQLRFHPTSPHPSTTTTPTHPTPPRPPYRISLPMPNQPVLRNFSLFHPEQSADAGVPLLLFFFAENRNF